MERETANTREALRGFDCTPEERAAILRYKRFMEAKRRATLKKPMYLEVDRLFPRVDPQTREELVEAMFSRRMSEISLKRVNRTA